MENQQNRSDHATKCNQLGFGGKACELIQVGVEDHFVRNIHIDEAVLRRNPKLNVRLEISAQLHIRFSNLARIHGSYHET